MAQRAILLAALAAAAPYLYDRYVTMSTMLANHPANYEYSNTFKHSEVKFSDRVRNCEDVLIEEAMGIAFLSCNPGRDQWNTVMRGTFVPAPVKKDEKDTANIWIYDYSTPNIPESEALKPLKLIEYPNAADFQPLAIEYEAATSTLYLINHSRNSGNILEVFQVSVKDATAKHVKTLKHPMLPTPNSMHNLGNGKLLVTNDHYFGALTSPLLSKIETFSAVPGGSVVYMDLHNKSAAKTLAHVGFANGITMLNATIVAVASTAKPGVYFYNFNPETITLDYVSHFRVPAAVDNLSVDSKGKLLMAGHPFAFALMAVSKARANCDWNGDEEQKKACELSAPSWVAEWSEEGGLQTVYKDSGAEFGSSTTFARDVGRGVGIVTGLYQRGILVGKV